MVFSSYEFIFGFLPIVLLVYCLLAKLNSSTVSKVWLVFASLFFYGFWDWNYIYLIAASIIFNYFLSQLQAQAEGATRSKIIFGAALFFNLSLLGYFKYLNFFFDNMNFLTGGYNVEKILLPIGLSFYTFQQISYQVSIFSGRSKPRNFLDYSLFVSFFPQLISGPIVHHAEMLPQFSKKTFSKPRITSIIIGFCVFSVGLFKKVVLADTFAKFANPVFDGSLLAESGTNFIAAWSGAIAYGFQLYFDFSGYSDMAVGLGIMFGIKLPFNFFSPLKAKNMIEFWGRWHISLTREITNLLYTPLSMNSMRKAMGGKSSKAVFFLKSVAIPTLVVWFIVGAWHGAGWNYILMGLLFGIFIVFNHATKNFVYNNTEHPLLKKITKTSGFLAIPTTFIAYIIAVVLFRAENVQAALNIYSAMLDPNFANWQTSVPYIGYKRFGVLLAVGAFIVWCLPNSILYFSRYNVGIDIFSWKSGKAYPKTAWRLNLLHVGFCALLATLSLFLMSNNFSEFIYFAF